MLPRLQDRPVEPAVSKGSTPPLVQNCMAFQVAHESLRPFPRSLWVTVTRAKMVRAGLVLTRNGEGEG